MRSAGNDRKLIELQGVRKAFHRSGARRSLIQTLTSRAPAPSGATVLEEIKLTVYAGESVGLMGGNGAGKTTLLKIIAGILPATTGRVEVDGRVLPLFAWNACFLDDLSGAENAVLYGAFCGIAAPVIRKGCSGIFANAGLTAAMHQPLRTYSPGMRARLTWAVAETAPADIVLIDEVHASMDADARNRVIDTIDGWKRQGRAILHATHDLNVHRLISDRCLTLLDGRLIEVTPAAAAVQGG